MTSAINRTRGVTLATNMTIAATFLTRLRGLLGTRPEEFGAGAGLWIFPSKGVHALGMRFAIDAVYLDRNYHVVHCECGLRPGRLGAVCKQAAGVLELPAGTVAASQTQVGDVVVFGGPTSGWESES